MHERKPWVVCVWEFRPGPGAAGNPSKVETVHVFPSHESFECQCRRWLEEGRIGRVTKVYCGDPKECAAEAADDDWDLARDRVYFHKGS